MQEILYSQRIIIHKSNTFPKINKTDYVQVVSVYITS